MDTTTRLPIVAGAFYPAHAETLREAVEALFEGTIPSSDRPLHAPVGLIAPHAGYAYSGGVAAAGYARAAAHGRPDAVVFLGANHTGLGAPISLSAHDRWATPIGRSTVDSAIVGRLAESGLPVSDAAFAREHSIEVQLPFVQAVWGCDVPIVPLCVQSSLSPAGPELVDALARALEGQSALVVASSDFTHYEPDATARELDRSAIETIVSLDADRFARVCRERRLSICGTGAILLLLGLCQRWGRTRGELVRYATSGDTTGDRGAVVGYASVVFTTEGP